MFDGNEVGSSGNYGDFEDFRPELASNEETVSGRVVRDAIENRFVARELIAGHESFEVNPAEDAAVRGRYTRDPIGMPDVGVDLAVNVFKLVELCDGLAVVGDGKAANFLEGVGIEEAQNRAAVAEDERSGIVRETPAFTLVVEGAEEPEGQAIVNECGVRLPRELDECVLPIGKALPEVSIGIELHAKNSAGLEIFFAQCRLPLDSGALVEMAVDIDQSLSECVLIVRISVHDAVGVCGMSETRQPKHQRRGE